MTILGVPAHELLIAAVFGVIFGILGYFLTRLVSPVLERLLP